MISKKKIFALILWATIWTSNGQQSFTAPEAPKTFEYTKYDQIPVGEYTGIPDIGIPLYTMTIDNVSIPLNLQYHAGGIRVSEEASFVGLGWNLNFGIISQTINGIDDLLDSNFRTKQKILYQSTGMGGPAQQWPITCEAFTGTSCSAGGTVETFFGGNNFKPLETDYNSMFITTGPVLPHTGLGFPISGSQYGPKDYSVTDPKSDFEPDIFRVNFFGHSLKFMLNFDTTGVENVIILDNKGYKITKTINSVSGYYDWNITTPEGVVYIFSNYRKDQNSSSGAKILPDWTYSGGGLGSTSYNNKWYLSKIITLKNKTITFNYIDNGTITSRSFDQKYRKIQESFKINTNNYSGVDNFIDYNLSPNELTETIYNKNIENGLFLTSIESDNVSAYFSYSSRFDHANDLKLDNIKIKNRNSEIIKEYSFLYDYFISANSGKTIGVSNTNATGTYETLKRLKLLSVQETGMNPYSFVYDPVILPQKNSTAVDFFGFYNGQINNNSIAPNPYQLGYTDLGNNGNNNASNITYSRACSLKEITYPTGGKSSYLYELNEFNVDNLDTALPNSDGTIGAVIKGNGNRINSISLLENGVIQKQTNYTYSGGKSIVPIELKYTYNMTAGQDEVCQFRTQYLLINDFKSSSYFQPSLFSTINGIGYDKVTTEEIYNGVPNGKTVFSFYNNRALASNNSTYYKNFMTLPARENVNSIENGKIISKEFFDKSDYVNPVKRIVNAYNLNKSNLYYSTKISPFRSIFYVGTFDTSCIVYFADQYLVGYYLIQGKHSLLSNETTTDYFPTGAVTNKTDYSYDDNNQITSTTKSNSVDGVFYQESTVYSSSPSSLVTKNILNFPLRKSIYTNGKIKEQVNYSYEESSGIVVLKKMGIYPLGNPDPSKTKSIFYDSYDVNGNVTEFHNDNGIHTCVIWGYNKTQPIAKIENASYSQIASALGITTTVLDTYNESNLTTINNLRTNTSLPNTMVTTYTHIPLVGVSTITDPRGDKITYTYDNYGKLLNVKDAQGKLLSENQYHYKN